MTKAIIDAAHKRNARVLAHVFYLEDAKRLANQGIDGFVHRCATSRSIRRSSTA